MPSGFLDVTAKRPDLLHFRNRCASGYAPSCSRLCIVADSDVSGYLSRFLRRALTCGNDPAIGTVCLVRHTDPYKRRGSCACCTLCKL
nr:MAG TPA: hypothetical protein [Caudoviricetes sp.]